MKPAFFKTPAAFGKWLERHADTKQELLVGFYKADFGKPSISWPESVDEALRFGWIDGVRKRIDDVSYTIRFSPRKATSVWSSVNTRRARQLIDEGRMTPAGLTAFEARRANKSGIYSYEKRPDALVEPYAGVLAQNAKARKFFEAQPPSYKRAATWFVLSAKKDETRLKRAQTLIEVSAAGKWLPQFLRSPAAKRSPAVTRNPAAMPDPPSKRRPAK
jgi:uncharacterized protein YdeI (YjbR/CyaY-like superfamily)